ncbi:hypothetical protein [Aquabacterium sp. CECT 9606]|uniref:hypothetical protein n=1 Tax=Aquabacterium sp. CECT 9606 TaxID=2845822 RepID=UPI001E61466D|nr:hypothetical protein [Aquabacterium sp. CECT 9606]CAH0354055.1 hypothetical protein AQB9606_03452 [Aquabacterium sp. CECT 9606]
MDFDIEGAKRAGYSDQEIVEHLSKQSGFDVAGARKAGYNDAEIVGHMQGNSKQSQPQEEGRSLARSGAEGLWRSAAGIGDTLLSPVKAGAKLVGADGVAEYLDRIPEAMRWMDQENASNPISYGAGRLVGDIVMTAPIGGVAGAGLKAVGTRAGLPMLEKLGTSVATGGLRTGAPAATTLAGKAGNMAIRAGGGAVNGGLSAGAIDPESAGTGAMIGGALPLAAKGVSTLARSTASGVRKVSDAIAPLNPKNDQRILGKFMSQQVGPELDGAVDALRKYKQTGPAVAGYQPTTAEVARVPSLAAMQRTATAVDPLAMNGYSNTAARNQDLLVSELEDLAGRDGQRMFTEASRDTTANKLYQQAYSNPIDPALITKPVQKQIDSLVQKPAMQEAINRARTLAKNEGLDISGQAGSLRGLHYAKTELDAMIRDAATPNQKRILSGLQGDLLKVLDKLSPDYAAARAEYAAMSKPVNQFDVLEQVAQKAISPKRTLTLNAYNRASGDKTAQAAIRNPKATMADVLEPGQYQRLGSVRSALEGLDFTQNAGRGVGSDTVQKLATANRMPGAPVGGLLGKIPGTTMIGGLLSKGADALYSSANQRLQERLTQGLLDPSEGLALLEAAYPQLSKPGMAAEFLARIQQQGERALPLAFRSAPGVLAQ